MQLGLYINNKTKMRYRLLNRNIKNATNGNKNEDMVLYEDILTSQKFVRNTSEFKEKFTIFVLV